MTPGRYVGAPEEDDDGEPFDKKMKRLTSLLRDQQEKGKKLGFICQEIGREINTIGSKANNSEIQSKVVEMKTSLEKIREQVLNIVWNQEK